MNKPTVVRTRGQVAVKPASFGADLVYTGAYGLCIVTSDALAAGVASVPGPFEDPGWDGWFVWWSFAQKFEVQDLTGTLLGADQYEIDSKAMRKIGTNEAVVLVAESQIGAFDIAMHLRMLLKLS